MIDYKMILLPFLISVILTPLVKQYSIYCGAYAKENKRTVHHGKISRIGGVAIYLAFIITMAICEGGSSEQRIGYWKQYYVFYRFN